MRSRKTYFILPTSDYDATHIKLGQIINDMQLPYRALSPPLNTPQSPLPEINTAYKVDYTFDYATNLSGAVGVQTQFLAQLGSPLGADINVSGERENTKKLETERLETHFIEPGQKYVEDSVLQVPVVKAYLHDRKLAGSVYMVTGIKIAKGAKYSSKEKRGNGGGGGITVDATALAGVPVSGGPQAKVKKSTEVGESYTSCSDFVFAYRVQRVSIAWFWGTVKSKEKDGGHLSGVGDDEEIDLDDVEDELEPLDIIAVNIELDEGSQNVPSGYAKAENNFGADDDQSDNLLYQLF
jgi:hypothetical protein